MPEGLLEWAACEAPLRGWWQFRPVAQKWMSFVRLAVLCVAPPNELSKLITSLGAGMSIADSILQTPDGSTCCYWNGHGGKCTTRRGAENTCPCC